MSSGEAAPESWSSAVGRTHNARPILPPRAPSSIPAIASITMSSGGKLPSETFACVPAIAWAIRMPAPKMAPPTSPRSAPPQPSWCSKPARIAPRPAPPPPALVLETGQDRAKPREHRQPPIGACRDPEGDPHDSPENQRHDAPEQDLDRARQISKQWWRVHLSPVTVVSPLETVVD